MVTYMLLYGQPRESKVNPAPFTALTPTTPLLRDTPSVPPRCIAAVVRRLGGMLLETPARPRAGGEFLYLP